RHTASHRRALSDSREPERVHVEDHRAHGRTRDQSSGRRPRIKKRRIRTHSARQPGLWHGTPLHHDPGDFPHGTPSRVAVTEEAERKKRKKGFRVPRRPRCQYPPLLESSKRRRLVRGTASTTTCSASTRRRAERRGKKRRRPGLGDLPPVRSRAGIG